MGHAGVQTMILFEEMALFQSLREDADLKEQYPSSGKKSRNAYKVTCKLFAQQFVQRHTSGEFAGQVKSYCSTLDLEKHKARYFLHRDTYLIFG